MYFIGRKNELDLLSEQLSLEKSSLIAILGRRRIGKSTLIKHYASKNKIPLYEFQGLSPRPEMNNKDQLKHFSETLASYLNVKSLSFENWSQALAMLGKLPLTKKSIVFLDEISWMGGKDPDFCGKLKEQWDITLSQNKNLVLIICGSVSSWIQRNILSQTGFAGRISLELNLPELSLKESGELLKYKKKNLGTNEIAMFLSVTGGVPKYLEEMNPKETVENNLKIKCFNPSGFLFSEFDKIFSEIFGKKHALYKKILHTLEEGPKQTKRIAQKLRVPLNGDLSDSLNDLVLGGFIAEDSIWDFTGKQKRTTQFRISDNYTRFYLKYIFPRQARIKNKPVQKNDSFDFLNWNTIFGFQFETLIKNNPNQLVELLQIPSSDIVQLGPYFQTKTKEKEALQIDYLIQCKQKILHLVEIKSGKNISSDIIKEVKLKVKKLKTPRGFIIRTHLVYLGDLAEAISEEDFFDKIIPFEKFLN